MVEIVGKGLTERTAGWKATLAALAYERLKITRRQEEIDKEIDTLESALSASEMVAKDNRTEIVVAEAKAQATKPPAPTAGAETVNKE